MTRTASSTRLLFFTLCLTYVATGSLSALPGASLIQLANDTRVSLQVAGVIFTVSASGFLLGAPLAGTLIRYVKPRYLLALGLFFLAAGSVVTSLTGSFAVLLVSQGFKGFGFGFIDIALNTLATLAFREGLSAKLNVIHGMYGLGALIGPLILAGGLQFFHSLPLAYFAGMAVALLTIALILAPRVREVQEAARNQRDEKTTDAHELRALLRQKLLWLMVLQISIYTSAEIGFGNWIVTAVSKSANITLALAAPAATAFFIGLTVGRLGGAQLLKRGWLTEARLLYIALLGGATWSMFAAIFSSHLVLAYGASALVGCFYGPLFPSLMAIASRRFVHTIGAVSTVMMVGTGASSTIVPAAMGLLIPVIGINWVMGIPVACCLLIIAPMALANHLQRTTLQSADEQHTITIAAKSAGVQ